MQTPLSQIGVEGNFSSQSSSMSHSEIQHYQMIGRWYLLTEKFVSDNVCILLQGHLQYKLTELSTQKFINGWFTSARMAIMSNLKFI